MLVSESSSPFPPLHDLSLDVLWCLNISVPWNLIAILFSRQTEWNQTRICQLCRLLLPTRGNDEECYTESGNPDCSLFLPLTCPLWSRLSQERRKWRRFSRAPWWTADEISCGRSCCSLKVEAPVQLRTSRTWSSWSWSVWSITRPWIRLIWGSLWLFTNDIIASVWPTAGSPPTEKPRLVHEFV